MPHTFIVKLPEHIDITTGVTQVREGVEAAGGEYQFNGSVGSFCVKGVAGTFSIAENRDVIITINKKPFIVSNGYVEKAIRGYFV